MKGKGEGEEEGKTFLCGGETGKHEPGSHPNPVQRTGWRKGTKEAPDSRDP